MKKKEIRDVELMKKVNQSHKIILQAYKKYPHSKIVLAWTGGKDSTVMLHLVKQACKGTIPSPVMFNDSKMEFQEIYDFIRKIKKDWGLNLVVVPHNQKELEDFHRTKSKQKKKELSRIMKVHAIESFLREYPIDAFLVGIRWDEHESRSKEKYFSQRKDHVRIHPILHFSESDIWAYIKKFNVPYVNLYDKGYRSLGEKPFTKKAMKGGGERSGREKDKENLMERLRNIGYW